MLLYIYGNDADTIVTPLKADTGLKPKDQHHTAGLCDGEQSADPGLDFVHSCTHSCL